MCSKLESHFWKLFESTFGWHHSWQSLVSLVVLLQCVQNALKMVVGWQPKSSSYFGNSQFPHRTLIFSRSETHGSVEKCIFLRRMNSNFLMVSDLPDDGPEIRGGQPRYNIGDSVNVTCISRNSLPAAKLSWYINGEKADPIYLRTYPEETNIRTQLQTSTLGLTFKVNTKDKKGPNIDLLNKLSKATKTTWLL